MLDKQVPVDQALEILEAQKEHQEIVALQEFKVLVDTLGTEEVMNRMDGHTWWKLFTYFKDGNE